MSAAKSPLLPVEDALARILAHVQRMPAERLSLDDALGRTLSAPIIAGRDSPPADVSSMDGYAVRSADALQGARLKVVGAIAAGSGAALAVAQGTAVRIFTGALVPPGADAVVIQEETAEDKGTVEIKGAVSAGAHIRRRGADFAAGTEGLAAGRCLTARDIAFAAAMNTPAVMAARRPRIAVLATGDELVAPGDARRPQDVIASSVPALAAAIRLWGGEPYVLGRVGDDPAAITKQLQAGADSDILVTLGGASVGDHDHVREALGAAGYGLDFWKIAMKPGKPMIFGRRGTHLCLGLPGNPVSTMICALVFLRAAILTALGADRIELPRTLARLGADLPPNQDRLDFMRGTLHLEDGAAIAAPSATQDSSQVRILAEAGCLIPRTPFAQAAKAGDLYPIVPLSGLF